MQSSNEQAETKKRKAGAKDDSKKLKKQKAEEKKVGLTLNAPVKCVEILHVKVINLPITSTVHIQYLNVFFYVLDRFMSSVFSASKKITLLSNFLSSCRMLVSVTACVCFFPGCEGGHADARLCERGDRL